MVNSNSWAARAAPSGSRSPWRACGHNPEQEGTLGWLRCSVVDFGARQAFRTGAGPRRGASRQHQWPRPLRREITGCTSDHMG